MFLFRVTLTLVQTVSLEDVATYHQLIVQEVKMKNIHAL